MVFGLTRLGLWSHTREPALAPVQGRGHVTPPTVQWRQSPEPPACSVVCATAPSPYSGGARRDQTGRNAVWKAIPAEAENSDLP